jgi:transglutaminase-like putative cysteine protease
MSDRLALLPRMNGVARYRVMHETDYRYGSAVSLSQQLLHLTPRELPWQRCLGHSLHIDPPPSYCIERDDCFGNPVTQLAFDAPHARLLVLADSEIEVLPRPLPALDRSPAWETVRDAFAYSGGAEVAPGQLEAAQFLYQSPHLRVAPEFADFAASCFTPGAPLLLAVAGLMAKIFSEFSFDPQATTIATPVAEVLAKRRGVCQDFAHLMLSCLRSLGLPARYVSGYLLTDPPPGQPRLIGADASHAWVSVYCPGAGWVDFDPTNNRLADSQYITLGWGNDFADVSPMRGVILGGDQHELEVRVTVLPLQGADAVPLGQSLDVRYEELGP